MGLRGPTAEFGKRRGAEGQGLEKDSLAGRLEGLAGVTFPGVAGATLPRVRPWASAAQGNLAAGRVARGRKGDRKSTRLNSSHRCISYAVFCLKKNRTDDEVEEFRGLVHAPDAGFLNGFSLAHQREAAASVVGVHFASEQVASPYFFFFNDGGTTEFSPLPLNTPLPF